MIVRGESMLNFQVYIHGKPPKRLSLRSAYLFGQDDVPIPAEIHYSDGLICCTKRNPGLVGLVLLKLGT